MSRGEALAAAVLLVLAFALRTLYALHYRFDSDESQHLHVVWAWTQGLLPYRDLFDNHAPLFHIVCAPVLALIGERADALVLMRLAMFPLYALVLASVFALGRALFSSRVGLWAAVLTGLWPEHFLTSTEFRADDLWAAAWLLGLALLLAGRLTRGRALAAGLALGASFGTSFKTSLLALTLAGAALMTLGLLRLRGRGSLPPGRALWGRAALLAAGLLGVPLLLAAWFAARGALDPFFYGTVGHNVLPGLGLWTTSPSRWLLFPASLPVLALFGHGLIGAAPRPRLGARRALLLLSTGLYASALASFWPLVTPQDHLPSEPVAILILVGLLAGLGRGAGAARALRRWWPALAAAGEIAALLDAASPWRDEVSPDLRVVGDVLRLTRPGEPVMDLKGETIFRPRPVYWVYESITRERLRRGLVPDSIPERLAATRTAVAVNDNYFFPPRGRAFMNANYLGVGSLRVLGRMLRVPRGDPGAALPFAVAIPARYALLAEGGPARGALDGVPYRGPRALSSGAHEYRPAPGETRVALVWARAAAAGFAPFPTRAP